jgi:aspartate carbamoyltransferase catalytic subunit
LLDLYTITKHFPDILTTNTSLRVTFVGDLRYGRTVHSLALLLRNFPQVQMTFVAPENLNIPTEYTHENDVLRHTLSSELISQSDVIYMTRIQKERFPDLVSYNTVKNLFILDEKSVR